MSRRSNGEGAVYQTNDGRWRATVDMGWQDGKRKRKYLSGRTKAEVTKKVRDALTQAEAGLPFTTDGRGPTVGEWLWHWWTTVQHRRVRENTLRAQESFIRLHLEPNIGRIRLRALTPEHVEAMEAKLPVAGLGPSSVLKVHRTLARALKVAMQRGLVARNVCLLVEPPSVPEFEVEPLTVEEARRVLAAAAKQRNSCRWSIALALGLRQGEALGLAWPNVDLDEGTLAVKQALNKAWWKHGCGAPATCGNRFAANCPERVGHGRRLDVPKSRAGKRVISLPAPLVEQLRAHRTAQLEERLAAGDRWWTPTEPAGAGQSWDLVFRTADGRPVQARTDLKHWKALLVEAKVRETRLHNARHTAASMLLALKVPPRVVMEVLGHSQISLTMNTYSHVMPELQKESADLVGHALWGDGGAASVTDLPASRAGKRKRSS